MNPRRVIALSALLLPAALPLLHSQQVINGSRTIVGGLVAAKATDTRPLMLGIGAPASSTCSEAKAITGATNASPIVITSNSHGYANGDIVVVYNAGGNTNANGVWMVGGATTNTFQLCGYWDGATCQSASAGNATYTSGGFASRHIGRMYFRQDATAGQNAYYCTDTTGTPAWTQQLNSGGGRLAGCGNPATAACVIDELMSINGSLFGSLNWISTTANSGATAYNSTAIAGHPGSVRLNSSIAANGTAALSLATFASTLGQFSNSADLFDTLFILRTQTEDTANGVFRFGTSDLNTTVQPSNGCYFEKAAGDSTWSAVCRASGVQTKTNTTVAVDTNWHEFRLYATPAGTINFTIDGGNLTTITTNVPSASTTPFLVVNNNNAVASEILDFDHYSNIVTVSR